AAACTAAGLLAALGYARVAWLARPLGELADGHASREPSARLWKPSPFLERIAPRLAPGRALDVAAGAGRDAVFLAGLGWRIDAWDHDAEALARARALASRNGVSITTRVVALEHPGLPDPGAGWDLVAVCRFLSRPLMPWLERAVAPGGALVYETFLRGQEAFGHPRQPRFLLEPGELAQAFPSLATECYEESAPAGGPILARLFARRAPH
ncbi:MAG TPA: methyltransferase domain-containing protein, partial [Candidatus Acidoferrales bacterium]|nr:methyltransferase domain-containing protein [Candidatus Acidoferrales bacterium]